MRVVLTDHMQPNLELEKRCCAEAGLELVVAEPQCRSADDVVRAAQGAEALLLGYVPITAAALDALPDLKIIAVPQVGYDSVDVEALEAKGVWLANVPGGNATEVAAHTLAMALALLRQIPLYDQHVRAGGWDYEAGGPLRRLGELTYGLLGLGRIARFVAERAKPFFRRVVAHDPFLPQEAWPSAITRIDTPQELFSASNVLSIHMPLTAANEGLVDATLLGRMPQGSYLINVARGPIVDSQSLIEALDDKRLAGAALDVLPQEPPMPDDPLLRHEKVLLSPHAAFYSIESDEETRRTAIENIAAFARTGRPLHVVVEGRSG